MNQDYSVLKRVSEQLVLIESVRYGEQLWQKAKCRKHMTCCITKENLYKKDAYRPITNGYNRMHRVKAEIVERAIELLQKEVKQQSIINKMRTEEEKQKAIKALEREKTNLPSTSFFGDDNHGGIDFAIKVIEYDYSEDDVYDEIPDSADSFQGWGLSAAQWLNGEIELDELIGEK